MSLADGQAAGARELQARRAPVAPGARASLIAHRRGEPTAAMQALLRVPGRTRAAAVRGTARAPNAGTAALRNLASFPNSSSFAPNSPSRYKGREEKPKPKINSKLSSHLPSNSPTSLYWETYFPASEFGERAVRGRL